MRLFGHRPQRALHTMRLVGAGLLNKGEESTALFEVEIVERAGDMAKVRLVNVSGVENRRDVRALLPEWLPVSQLKIIRPDTIR